MAMMSSVIDSMASRIAAVHVPVEVWREYWPVLVGAVAVLVVWGLVRGPRSGVVPKPAKGWRVGHQGRDSMYYEEKEGGEWRRIPIDGEMLMGRAHHVIYFSSIRWPEWAAGRHQEIIARIKSAFPEPDYEYEER